MKTETQDQQFAVIEEDLYRWGDWVRRSSVGKGYGDSSFSRLSKAKTKKESHRQRRLIISSPTVEIQYRDGAPVSAHYVDTRASIPVQAITSVPTRENVWMMKREDRDDALGLEIDGYLATLRGIRPRAFRAAKCKFMFQWPRELILDDLKCSKTEYMSLIRDAMMHVLTCRARAYIATTQHANLS